MKLAATIVDFLAAVAIASSLAAASPVPQERFKLLASGGTDHDLLGLRCAGGSLIRLQIRTADAGGISLTTIPIATKGGVSAGDTKRYQCWYRTTVNPPCGVGVNDFNLSNGYEITWRP